MPTPKVLIILLNWNGKNDTIECIESLKKLTYTEYDILVIDNGSSEDPSDAFKQLFPDILIIRNGCNLGFAGGNNIGIQYGLDRGYEYLLLLNNDTIVDSGFLDELIDASDSDAKIGIVGPIIYQYDNKNVVQSAGMNVSKYGVKSDNIGYNEKDHGQFHASERDFITGCAMLVKRKVFEHLGGLDPKYFAYWEDMDFCMRARKKGFKIYFTPESRIWHKGSSSTGGYMNKTAYYYHIRNSVYFFFRNYSRIEFMTFFIFLISVYSLMLIGYCIINHRYDLFIAYIKAIRDSIGMISKQ